MSASIRFEGATELIRQLRELPRELQADATHIVVEAAQAVEIDVDEDYAVHEHTGNLRGGLTLNRLAAGPWGTGAVLRQRAKHAWIFENGTVRRRYTGTDRRGRTFRNADRGRMWGHTPHRPVFIPSARRHRRAMYQRLADLLRRAGFTVTGDV
jgi:hypothetical protein